MIPRPAAYTLALCLSFGAVPSGRAAVDARMLRHPDVSATQVAFAHAGDVWIAPKAGGIAHRLSTPRGQESFPRFSPDGSSLAYSANYDGNLDVYVVAASGGLPTRVTHHPGSDRVVDWSPDGRSVLVASGMESGKDRFNRLFLVPREGGLPSALPIPYGEFGAISPDGKTLAYTPQRRDFATWKRYRGGSSSDIWLFGLEDRRSRNLTQGAANDMQPMWHGGRLYFASDRGPDRRVNLWASDLATGAIRQITRFTDQDIHFPAIGPADIVFEQGGRLWRLALPDESLHEIPLEVVTDRATLKPHVVNVGDSIRAAGISPSGKRAVFEARGEILTAPAKDGVVVNLSRASGSAERSPSWSPDGKTIAWFSDASGEYELWLASADGTVPARKATSLGPGFRYAPQWSPDSKSIVFADNSMRIHLLDVASGKSREIDRGVYLFDGELRSFRVSWSADSRWMAWSRTTGESTTPIFVYDTRTSTLSQATSGFYPDTNPAFDPDGKYLFFLSGRTFEPSYGADGSWIYANTTNVVAAPLRADVASPVAPKNDVEGEDDEDEDEDDEDARPSKRSRKSRGIGAKRDEKAAKKAAVEEPPEPVVIDLEGFEQRVVMLPIPAGNYGSLQAVSGKIVYHVRLRTGAAEDDPEPVKYWDLKAREEKTILEDAEGFLVAAGGEKALALVGDEFAIVSVDEDQEISEENTLATDELEMRLDPAAEWRQIFADAWRFERDYFYDPGMHGVDWALMRTRYGALIDDCVTRWDVNYVIGELIGELNSSHTYRGGGDTESAPERPVGLLGCDFALDSGAFRIERILRGAAWDAEVRSPLDQPGARVEEGEWLLQVNGEPLDPAADPWASFAGLAGRTIELTVNSRPATDGARRVVVKALDLDQDARLRHLAWIEEKRRHVEERTAGRAAYVYVPDTGRGGQSELYRQFHGQVGKQALVVDERFNSGGQIPDRFVEMLNRPVLNYWAVRDGIDWRTPFATIPGPKVMLINAWSGSGGDAFPHYFRAAGLGPLIGTRTWGGLIGISGSPDLVDGGEVTVPTFSFYSTSGKWVVENHGVEPDIEVVDDPALMADGGDPQLDRAIDEILAALERAPHESPLRPAYPKR